MNIVICGANGFIGRNLSDYLGRTHTVSELHKEDFKLGLEALKDKFENADAVINLAGQNIFTIWNRKNKRAIYESRVYTTKKIMQAIKMVKNKPYLHINASGVNIYDEKGKHTEQSGDFADNFLSYVVSDWEKAALEIREEEVKVAIARFGTVIGENGGIIKQLRKYVASGLGFKLMNMNPHFSFIHIEDLCRGIEYLLKNPFEEIIFNFTSPNPTTFNQFMDLFAKKSGRKIFMKLPAGLPKVFGENNILLTKGPCVYPRVLQQHNFKFLYPDLSSALDSVISAS